MIFGGFNAAAMALLPQDTATLSRTLPLAQTASKNHDFFDACKRAFDIVASAIALLISCIPIAIAAIAIKATSRGPVIFKQIRVGKDGKLFKIYKLRSMYIDAEKNGVQWAQTDDDRVTHVGKFIRRTRMDELPQFWNVIKGDMSLIGPRPERPEFVEVFNEFIPNYQKREQIRPGISGLAQVSGGYELLPHEKLVYDLDYIENRSFGMDAEVIIKTIGVIFGGDGAR
jgi:exopolysaccharide biosynthesis polyprenyl glycosylphosphotransferase